MFILGFIDFCQFLFCVCFWTAWSFYFYNLNGELKDKYKFCHVTILELLSTASISYIVLRFLCGYLPLNIINIHVCKQKKKLNANIF